MARRFRTYRTVAPELLAPPEPMPDQTPIPLADLLDGVGAALAGTSESWTQKVVSQAQDFVAACAETGITHVPDDRLAEVAGHFRDRATARKSKPSNGWKSARATAVRALLKEAARRDVRVPDPFATTYDRVAAGEDWPAALRLQTVPPVQAPGSLLGGGAPGVPAHRHHGPGGRSRHLL